jgi:hypothetical protein
MGARLHVQVYGGCYDNVWQCTHPLDEGQVASVGSLDLLVKHTPCHTYGSVMYLLRGVGGHDALFTGDSLFVGGTGAHFEGTEQDMMNNMRKVWLECSPSTLIFPGHEYTVPMLRDRFAEDPSMTTSEGLPRTMTGMWRLSAALLRAERLRRKRRPTVGTTLADEYGYNSCFDELHSAATLLQSSWRRWIADDEAADPEAGSIGAGQLDSVEDEDEDEDAAKRLAVEPSCAARAVSLLAELNAMADMLPAPPTSEHVGAEAWGQFRARLAHAAAEIAVLTRGDGSMRMVYDDTAVCPAEISKADETMPDGARGAVGSREGWQQKRKQLLEAFVTIGGSAPSSHIRIDDLRWALMVLGGAHKPAPVHPQHICHCHNNTQTHSYTHNMYKGLRVRWCLRSATLRSRRGR